MAFGRLRVRCDMLAPLYLRSFCSSSCAGATTESPQDCIFLKHRRIKLLFGVKIQLRWWRCKVSKRFGTWVTTWPLSATLAWCKKMINQYFRQVDPIDFAPANSEDDPSDVALAAKGSPLRVYLGDDYIDLDELIAVLRVGDRIRLFCDDGLLVAEKVSHTQLKVVHSQTMPAWIQ